MLIKNLTTSTDLYQKKTADIATIKNEVRQHGFYSAFCLEMADALSHDDLIRAIKAIAINAHLKVSFNAAESICVFEVEERFKIRNPSI